MMKSIIRLVRRSQRGFTLIELLVVMGVIGILAGIVTTSVSGTGETSNVAQARSDASTVGSAASSFFTDQDATFVAAQKAVVVTAVINADASTTPVTQEKSSRWPEVFITENSSDTLVGTPLACVASAYCAEFPTASLHADTVVISVTVVDSEGAAIDRTTLLETYTAVDSDTLADSGYIVAAPDSADQTADIVVGTKTIEVHNFLWLFRKSTSAGGGGADDARNVAVFKLASVKVTEAVAPATNGTLTLSYAQIL